MKTFSKLLAIFLLCVYIVSIMAKESLEKKGQKIARSYLARLLKSQAYIEKQIEDIPALVEAHVKRIISNAFSPKDISNFVLKELIEIYIQVNGRKQLAEYYKDKPQELLKLLLKVSEISNNLIEIEAKKEANQNGSNNNGVVVQFIGLDNPQPKQVKATTNPPIPQALKALDIKNKNNDEA